MKAYSVDLRERIVRAVADGGAKSVIARRFAVSRATVKNYVRQLATTGTCVPRRRAPRRPLIGADQEVILVRRLTEANDATLAEHVAWWAREVGPRVSLATMSRAIHRVGWTYKKRRWVPANATRQPARPSAPRSPRWTPGGLSRSTRRPRRSA